MGMKPCSICTEPHNRNGRYCRDCHAAYMREWRKSHPLTPEQRKKANARAYANVYQRRGKLIPQPCEDCGAPEAEKHHLDYDQPLLVTWICRLCHEDRHKAGKLDRAA
jgi:hypothetical protein